MIEKNNKIKNTIDNQDEIISFCRLLSSAVKSNLPLIPSLEKLTGESEKSRASRIAINFADKLKEGYSIEEASKALSNLDPVIARLLPLIGDARLIKVFDIYTKYLIRQRFCFQKVKFLISYPIIIMALAFCMLLFLNIYTFPTLLTISKPMGILDSLSLKLLYFMNKDFWPVSLICPLIFFYIFADCLYVFFTEKFSKYSLWAKVTKMDYIMKICDESKLAMAISVHLKAGLSVDKAIQASYSFLDTKTKNELAMVYSRLSQGHFFKDAFKSSGFMAQYLSGNENIDELPEVLEYIHEQLNSEALILLNNLSNKLFCMSLVFAGLIVLAISAGYFDCVSVTIRSLI